MASLFEEVVRAPFGFVPVPGFEPLSVYVIGADNDSLVPCISFDLRQPVNTAMDVTNFPLFLALSLSPHTSLIPTWYTERPVGSLLDSVRHGELAGPLLSYAICGAFSQSTVSHRRQMDLP